MKSLTRIQKIFFSINVIFICAIFVLNYFYQSNGFDYTLKCVCSMGFALLGMINLCYAFLSRQKNKPFYIGMASGLFLAMLGDVIINHDFIIGAAVFALGHISFVVAYCFLQRIKWLEIAIGGVVFIGAGAFLLFCPLLSFDEPIFRIVCLIYALIISLMLGKAISDFIRERNAVCGIIAIASVLFFTSDLMLVFDWFIGRWSWTNEVCMATYYPALCMLAFSMLIKALSQPKEHFK